MIYQNDALKAASYNVESLFTNAPIQETIHFMLDEIYFKIKLSRICLSLIFKRPLLKLNTENAFIFFLKFYK